jgi:hypothetical protein
MSSLVQHRLSQRRFQGSAPFFCYRFAVSSETVFQLRDFEFTRLSPLCQGVPLRLSLSEASSSLVIDLPPPGEIFLSLLRAEVYSLSLFRQGFS